MSKWGNIRLHNTWHTNLTQSKKKSPNAKCLSYYYSSVIVGCLLRLTGRLHELIKSLPWSHGGWMPRMGSSYFLSPWPWPYMS